MVKTIAPLTSLIDVKLAGSIVSCSKAKRHKTEFPANASMAVTVPMIKRKFMMLVLTLKAICLHKNADYRLFVCPIFNRNLHVIKLLIFNRHKIVSGSQHN